MARNGKGQEGERNRADRVLKDRSTTALPHSLQQKTYYWIPIPTVGIGIFFLVIMCERYQTWILYKVWYWGSVEKDPQKR